MLHSGLDRRPFPAQVHGSGSMRRTPLRPAPRPRAWRLMMSAIRRTTDMLRLMPQGGPSVCNIAVTNLCNATCDFCSFAYDKGLVTDRRYIDADRFGEALDILHGRGVRYLTFSGGETLLHPRLADMIRAAFARNFRPSVVTNGWLLPQKLPELRDAGLKSIII